MSQDSRPLRAEPNCKRVRQHLEKGYSYECDVCGRSACVFRPEEIAATVNAELDAIVANAERRRIKLCV